MPEADAGITLDDRGLAELAARVQRAGRGLVNLGTGRRLLVLIAGIPGAGKSTLTDKLWRKLEHAEPGTSAQLPMDGFHLSEAALRRMDLHAKKGAVETFDGLGYVELVHKASTTRWCGEAPSYSREVHEPVYTGQAPMKVTPSTKYLLSEGNYLLLDQEPWREARALARLTVWVDTPWDTALRWLKPRHEQERHAAEVVAAKLKNDRANALLIENRSFLADVVVRWP